jgi:hypothetical protein
MTETFQERCKSAWHNINEMPEPKADEEAPKRIWGKKK